MVYGELLLVQFGERSKKGVGFFLVTVIDRAVLGASVRFETLVVKALNGSVDVVYVDSCPSQKEYVLSHRRSHDPEIPAIIRTSLADLYGTAHNSVNDFLIHLMLIVLKDKATVAFPD